MNIRRWVGRNRWKDRLVLSVWLAAILLWGPPRSLAQSTSAILGTVKDTSGAVVPDATVTIVNIDTAQTRTTTSGTDGAFRVPALLAGHYTAKVDKSGFRAETQEGLTLDVAQELSINVTLQVGSAEQAVVVTAEAPQVNTTSSSLGGLVNEEKMADLPLNGRNYIDLSLMQPGVAQNKNLGAGGGQVGTFYSSNGAPTISNNFLLDGTSLVNQFGGSTSSEAGTTLGVDGIKEYKVITSAFSAEYGMTMGSQMVMVSKGGANQFHGDAFEYLRNSALDARNYFDPVKIPEFRRNNFGGSFGGPIKKDKTFFYAVYEGLREDLGFTGNDQVPAAACHGGAGAVIWNGTGTQPAGSIGPCTQLGSNPAGTGTNSVTIVNSQIAALLSLFPTPTNAANNTYTLSSATGVGVNFGQIRVDHNFSSADTFFGRYTTDESAIDSANATASAVTFSGVAFPQFRSQASSRNQFLTLSENHIFSNTLLNTVRISFSRTRWDFGSVYTTPLTGIPTFVVGEPFGNFSVGGLSAMGVQSSYGPPNPFHLQNVYTFGDDVNYVRGRHALKFGMLFNRFNEGVTAPNNAEGTASYTGLATFLRGIPTTYALLTPGSDVNRYFVFNTVGFYMQDDWRVTSRLTVNLGLRYEFFTSPWELNNKGWAIRNRLLDPLPTQGPVMVDKSFLNFSPRIGFAWDVFGNGRTSMRGAFGIYYDVANIGGAITQNAVGTPPLSTSTSVNNQTANAVVTFPFTVSASQIGKGGNTIFYNNGQPDVFQYNLSVEHQLPGNMTLSVAYVGTRGVHLWAEKPGNPSIPTAIVNGVYYWSSQVPACSSIVPTCRLNPNYAGFSLDQTAADSWYNSLQIVANKRLSDGLEFQAAYTYSHSLDTAEGQLTGQDCTASGMDIGPDPNVPRNNLGPSCFDLRHNVRFSLLYHFPNVKSDGFAAKLLNGWWTGNIVSVQTGYPFSPTDFGNRSNSGAGLGTGNGDPLNVGTATVAPGQNGPDGLPNSTTKTFIPFNSTTLYTGNPNQWFNPLMFTMQTMVPCPTNAALRCGTLGDASRGLLRGPGLGTWDFSIVKDTPAHFLGEKGSVEFRGELFNILNRPNFGMPSGAIFSGSTSDIGAYSEVPLSSAGQITTTATTSRQVQLALKLIF